MDISALFRIQFYEYANSVTQIEIKHDHITLHRFPGNDISK